jgi:GNAT superfamily N-acetyltransferase
MPSIEIVDVNASNVDELGFFCAMSRPELIGYQQKLAWAKERFREGLRIKIIRRGGRGFIEYMPGKYAWRAIIAPGYMVIHCLWVVGRAKGKGSGKALLEHCIRDAQAARMKGVAAVTARRKVGLVDTEFFVHNGFGVVESTPDGIDLVALKFKPAPDPRFPDDWETRGKALGSGLTVVSSPQCPYTFEGAQQIVSLAEADRIPARSVRINSIEQLRQSAPSPYASFDIAYNGAGISNLFHCMTAERLRKLVTGAGSQSSR